MKVFKLASTLLVVLAVMAGAMPNVMADCEKGESITITIDRGTKPSSFFHPGRFFTKSATVTVYEFVIRDYDGLPVESLIIQTSSGRTTVPINRVKEIRFGNWIKRESRDIGYVENVVKADIVLTNGTEKSGLMNADLGTIEGKTELGDFFLRDPHTLRSLVFNRCEKQPETVEKVVEKVEVAKVVSPLDTDGDGVIDDKDKCPATPKGVKVDEDGCPLDTDGDGVPDYEDRCPDTPKGAPVNSVGCWTIRGVLFDYDKWDIKPQYYGMMDENVRVLEMNPTLKVEIQGHTDSIASEQYNQTLSEKRAESAEAYFISKGISAERISTRGFGELKPIATNDTPEGRAQNRRIELKVISR